MANKSDNKIKQEKEQAHVSYQEYKRLKTQVIQIEELAKQNQEKIKSRLGV